MAFFDYVRSQGDPFAYLSSIPDQNAPHYPFFEQEWLDFKGYPKDDNDAKKIWSKALAGYANITDGLIIWGIDARKTPPRDIDAASNLRLVPDPHAFESKLRDWIRDATNPPVMSVEYKAYPGPGPAGEGFVICFIPKSDHKPHRAEWASHQYYYRAGDDFLPAQPGLLRTLFYPESSPHLRVEASLTYQLQPKDVAESYAKEPKPEMLVHLLNTPPRVSLEARVYNAGTAMAKNVFIVVQATNVNLPPGWQKGSDWHNRTTPIGQVAFEAQRPLHPGDISMLFRIDYQNRFSTKRLEESRVIPAINDISMRFLLYADNARPQSVTVAISDEDVVNTHSGPILKRGDTEPWVDPF
jgi:hypothetical protein